MGVIIRQSIQNTVISYLGVALGFILTILLFPHVLTRDQYGLTRVLISLALVSAQFAHLGMKNVIIRYFPHFKSRKSSPHGLLLLALVVPLAGMALFTLVLFLFSNQLVQYYADQSALFSTYYLYLIPLVAFTLYFEVLNSYVRALQDSVTGSLLNEILVRLILILLLVLYYFDLFRFPVFMGLFILAYGIQPAGLMLRLYLQEDLGISIPFQKRETEFAKEVLVYGAYAMLGGLTTLLVGNIDIIMLGSMTDLANTAVYAIAFYTGSVIVIPRRSINKIATPILAGLLKNKKYAEIESLYKRTALNQIIAGSLLLVGIWANMDNLLYLLPEEYSGARWVIIVIGFAKLFDMATGINGSIISNSRYYRFDFYINIFLVLLTIATNYIFIPFYGILGAAFATALSIMIYNLVKFIFVWITFSMQPFRWNALGVLLAATGCLLVSFQIPYMSNFVVDVTVRSGIIASLFLAIIVMFNLSDDVKLLIRETMRRISNFFTTRSPDGH